MASEGLAKALTAVLGGQGLLVQSYDSEPLGNPRVPVRLRKNVCYVVLAVFLNEQVSVRPPASAEPRERTPGQVGTDEPTAAVAAALCVALPSCCKAPTLAIEPCDCLDKQSSKLKPRGRSPIRKVSGP
jgi:hypothetical protein